MAKYTPEQYEQDLTVIRNVEDEGIDLEGFYSDIDRKIELLKELGYRNLRTGANRDIDTFLPIEDCEDDRISAVVRERYYTALRRIGEYEEGKRKVVNPAKKQSPLVRALLEETRKYREDKERIKKEEIRKRKESGEQTDLFG